MAQPKLVNGLSLMLMYFQFTACLVIVHYIMSNLHLRTIPCAQCTVIYYRYSGSVVLPHSYNYVYVLCKHICDHHLCDKSKSLLTLGAHAQRGLQYLVCKLSVRLLDGRTAYRPSTTFSATIYTQQGGQKAIPTGSVPHWLDFENSDFRKSTAFKSYANQYANEYCLTLTLLVPTLIQRYVNALYRLFSVLKG